MQLIVTDREGIETGVRVRTCYVVISVRDPRSRKPKVLRQPGLLDVLYVAFDDAEPSRNLELPASIRLMTPSDARAIWDFVERYRYCAGTIVIHCEQGMSRSPAIAATIARHFGVDDTKFWREHQPSAFVRGTLEASRFTGATP